MRQVLLGSTAVALVGSLPNFASAAEWEVRVGGFMEQYLAYASSDGPATGNGDFDGVDNKFNAEIHFLPSITLDNGITIGADIQLEGQSSGDQIDESFMRIEGSFGEVLLGSTFSAGYLMHYGAPDVTFVNINSGSMTQFIPFSGTVGGVSVGSDIFYGTLGSTYLENLENDAAHRFTYFTPRFAGFQLGVSYARDAGQDSNAQIDCNAATCDFFDIGANYVNEFGELSVALAGRWGIASGTAGSNPTIWSAGGQIGYAGFAIGGSFAEQNDSALADGQAWDAGVSYTTGPWGVSFTYFHGRNFDDETGVGGNAGQFGVTEELTQYLIGVSYALAEGVTLNGFGAYVDFDEDTDDTGAAAGDDIDGFVIGTGIKIEF